MYFTHDRLLLIPCVLSNLSLTSRPRCCRPGSPRPSSAWSSHSCVFCFVLPYPDPDIQVLVLTNRLGGCTGHFDVPLHVPRACAHVRGLVLREGLRRRRRRGGLRTRAPSGAAALLTAFATATNSPAPTTTAGRARRRYHEQAGERNGKVRGVPPKERFGK